MGRQLHVRNPKKWYGPNCLHERKECGLQSVLDQRQGLD